MKQTTHPKYIQPITGQYKAIDSVSPNQEIVQRVTGLITLAFNMINILILIRFLLDVLNASSLNPFAQLIYTTSQPFLSMFQGLTYSPLFRTITLELTTLIAITIYSLLAWSLNRLIHILFAQ